MNYVSPEAIYNYGDKIPRLQTDEGLIIPAEKEFNLLIGNENLEEIEELSNLYHIVYLATYDLNTAQKNTRSHRSRLVNKLYRLSLK